MSKKRLNTILIIALACIWSVVLYKFIAPYFETSDPNLTADVSAPPLLLKTIKKDTFTLELPDRDPFLGKGKKKKTNIQTPTKVRKKPKTVLKPVLWPKIQYLGFVKSSNSKARLGLVRIDGKLHRVNKNSEVAGLKIKNISNDALSVLNGKEERSFNKD